MKGITQEIMDMHGGTIDLRSPAENCSERFVVTLPIVDELEAS